jgi:hypothetical protein
LVDVDLVAGAEGNTAAMSLNVNHEAQTARTNMNVGRAARAKSSTVFEIPSSDSDESTMEIAGGSEELEFQLARGYKKVEGLGVFGLLNTESEERRKYPVPFQFSGDRQDHQDKGRDSNENYR